MSEKQIAVRTPRLAGKVAVVTGGASGIGRAVALRFSEEGAKLALIDLNETAARATSELMAAGHQAMSAVADVSDEDACQRAVAAILREYQRIDILVNSAGIARKSRATETTLESWNRVIGVNLTGSFLMSKLVAGVMAKGSGCSIVNIASVDAHGADPGFASYNASKAGILGLTRTLAIELAPSGIRVNSVSPGLVATPMVLEGTAPDSEVQAYLKMNFRRVPMRRLIEPHEIAAACAFLVSDDASAMTGADIIVDGGLTADLYLINSYPVKWDDPRLATR